MNKPTAAILSSLGLAVAATASAQTPGTSPAIAEIGKIVNYIHFHKSLIEAGRGGLGGVLQQTQNSTDLAVSGNGLFVTRREGLALSDILSGYDSRSRSVADTINRALDHNMYFAPEMNRELYDMRKNQVSILGLSQSDSKDLLSYWLDRSAENCLTPGASKITADSIMLRTQTNVKASMAVIANTRQLSILDYLKP